MKRVDYSKEGKLARAILYGDLNDLHIFVEDWEEEYLYREILDRILEGSGLEIRTIHCLGAKKDVINIYRDTGGFIEGVPCFYIVDGDFDRYVDPENMIDDPRFYYLERYNIESYYIEKRPIIRHIQGKLARSYREVEEGLDYDGWFSQIEGDYYELFLLFMYIQREGLGFSNSSLNHSKTFLDDRGGLDKDYMDEFRLRIGLGEEVWKKTRKELDQVFERVSGRGTRINLICGKFMLTGLNKWFTFKMKRHFNMQELIWDLVRNISTDSFNDLGNRMIVAAGGLDQKDLLLKTR